MLKKKEYAVYAPLGTLVLTIVALVFFGLSYTTGYIGIVFGEKNSVLLLILQIFVLGMTLFLFLRNKKSMEKSITDDIIITLITASLTVCLLLLFADRVDAIGNCIIAPWDAGHGGEDSCYLSFVSMGAYLMGLLLNIIVAFHGSKKKIINVIDEENQ